MAIQTQIEQLRRDRWSVLREIARAGPDLLKAMGYTDLTNVEALLVAFKRAETDIEKMIRAYEKANP